ELRPNMPDAVRPGAKSARQFPPAASLILTTRLFGGKTVSFGSRVLQLNVIYLAMKTLSKISTVILALGTAVSALAAAPQTPLLNDPVDVSGDFRDFSNYYYLADELAGFDPAAHTGKRSEEHTSELQSRGHLVCRLLLEK